MIKLEADVSGYEQVGPDQLEDDEILTKPHGIMTRTQGAMALGRDKGGTIPFSSEI